MSTPPTDEELAQLAQGDDDHLPRLAILAREVQRLRAELKICAQASIDLVKERGQLKAQLAEAQKQNTWNQLALTEANRNTEGTRAQRDKLAEALKPFAAHYDLHYRAPDFTRTSAEYYDFRVSWLKTAWAALRELEGK